MKMSRGSQHIQSITINSDTTSHLFSTNAVSECVPYLADNVPRMLSRGRFILALGVWSA